MGTIWLAFARALHRLSMLANGAGTLTVLALVMIVNYDVIVRNLLGKPFMGAVELVQFSLVFIVFLQLPDVVRVNRLTRSDGFLLLIGKRSPRAARWLQCFIDGLAAIFMTLVAYAIWPEFLEMLETRDYFGVPGVFTAPWWPIKFVIFASGALCTTLFVIKLVMGKRSPFDASPGPNSSTSPDADVAAATQQSAS